MNWPDPLFVQKWRGAFSLGWMLLLLLWESALPFHRAFQNSDDRRRHGLRNILIGLVNGLMTALIFAATWKGIADLAASHQFGLLHRSGLSGLGRLIFALLLLDLWTYFWHRAGHQLPHLWLFHRMHHSDAQMDVTTSNRFHLVEILLSSLLRILLIPLLGITFFELVIYETLLQFFVQLQHANVVLPRPIERGLRVLWVTPLMHKIHHSKDPQETDSNFASLFSFWDRLFGTYKLRKELETLQLGLDGFDTSYFQDFRGLWLTPFRKPKVNAPTHPPRRGAKP
jgi:sterol desaturase/sphingolipid hydroxylase (fatty acid hydroxylase superfamily)